MAEKLQQEKRTGEGTGPLLLPNLLVIGLLALGIIAAPTSLESLRPRGESATIPAMPESLQRVEARLWEDPFGAISKASNGVALSKLLDEATNGYNDVLFLGVYLHGWDTPEDAERRTRDRYAAVSALMNSGFMPKDNRRIGLATNTPVGDVAFEIFKPFSPAVDWPVKKYDAVVVLYVNQSAVNSCEQIRKMSDLTEKIRGRFGAKKDGKSCHIRLVGPNDSDSLIEWMDQLASKQPYLSTNKRTNAEVIEVFTPRATLPPKALSKLLIDRRSATTRIDVAAFFREQGGTEALCGRDWGVIVATNEKTWKAAADCLTNVLGTSVVSTASWGSVSNLLMDAFGLKVIAGSNVTGVVSRLTNVLGKAEATIWTNAVRSLESAVAAGSIDDGDWAAISQGVSQACRTSNVVWVKDDGLGNLGKDLARIMRAALVPKTNDGLTEAEVATLGATTNILLSLTNAWFLCGSSDMVFRSRSSGVRVERAGGHDGQFLAATVEELQARGVEPSRDRIAVISEYDTSYGRVMGLNLEGVLRPGGSFSATDRFDALGHSNLLFFSYLRGLDGATARGQRQEGETLTSAFFGVTNRVRRAEGRPQDDYLRRLAERLMRLDREEGTRIRAVGVLGSDVYDKMMILRALRPALPGAIFFTTDLDVLLLEPHQFEWARNLLIGSRFGLQLSEDLQGRAPPFRDSYQTAFYYSVLRAVRCSTPGSDGAPGFGRYNDGYLPRIDWEPRVFEVGRGMMESYAHPAVSNLVLDQERQRCYWRSKGWTVRSGGSTNGLELRDPVPPVERPVDQKALSFGVLALAGVMGWYLWLAVAQGVFHDPWGAGDTGRRCGMLLAAFLALPGTAMLVHVAFVALDVEEEPLGFANGLSAWPATIVQGWTVGFGLLLAFRLWRRRHVTRDWLLREARVESTSFLEGAVGRLTGGSFDSVADTVVIWTVALVGCVAACVVPIDEWVLEPVRGPDSRMCHYFVLRCVLAVAGGMALLSICGSCDMAVRLRRVRETLALSRWTGGDPSGRPVERDLWRLMRAVEDATKPACEGIFSPITVFLLIGLSRNGIIDNFEWPVGLIAFFAVSMVMVLAAGHWMTAVGGRLQAEAVAWVSSEIQSREAIAPKGDEDLEKLRWQRETIQSMTGGALGPIWTNPVARAALVPIGGLGSVALLQQGMDFFR